MDEFKASNGIVIRRNADQEHPLTVTSLGLLPRSVDALREFFLHERDEQLGRWRWPADPDYVVYPKHPDGGGRPDSFRVFQESTGNTWSYDLEHLRDTKGEPWDAARAYFDAHPEPKPWHDAKEGEVWVVTKEDTEGEFAAVVSDPRVTGCTSFDAAAISFPVTDPRITAGRRIWPQVKS